jgi:hypothetical protein
MTVAMPKLRVWWFVLRFAVFYALLILPWPGLHYAVGTYVQVFGSRVFGQSGRALIASLHDGGPRSVTTSIHHVVLFRAIGPADQSYSAATDTIVLLYNFDVVGKNRSGGSKIGLESKQYFWLPFAFYLALVGASSISWRHRVWALFWGFLAANFLLALTLTVYLADHASDISMIVLSPFWKSAVSGLTNLLLVVSGPSTFFYLLVWPFACFRRENLARLVPGWGGSIPKPAVADALARRQRKAEGKVARKSRLLADEATKLPAEKANNSKQAEGSNEPVARGTTTTTAT